METNQNRRTNEGLKERLKVIIGDEAPYTWARKIGIGKSTFAGLWNDGAYPHTSTLFKIALKSSVSLNWLLTGQGSPWLGQDSIFHLDDSVPTAREPGEPYGAFRDSFVLVPRNSIALNFGECSTFHSDQVVDHVAFKVDWIQSSMGLDPKKLALIHIIGDSMQPTLKEGDMVLLDQREQKVRNDAIYVLRLGDDLIAKRLQRGFDGSIVIKSDNQAYEDQKVTAEQAQNLHILGRVVWSGRRM